MLPAMERCTKTDDEPDLLQKGLCRLLAPTGPTGPGLTMSARGGRTGSGFSGPSRPLMTRTGPSIICIAYIF